MQYIRYSFYTVVSEFKRKIVEQESWKAGQPPRHDGRGVGTLQTIHEEAQNVKESTPALWLASIRKR